MEVIEVKRERMEHLISSIASLSGSQKLLTQTALDFQSLGIAKKHHIEDVIDQAEDLGEVLGMMIELLKDITEDLFNVSPEHCEESL